MANIEACDRCGRQSPENGLYVANDWFEVRVLPRENKGIYTDTYKNYIFCRHCWQVIKTASPGSW